MNCPMCNIELSTTSFTRYKLHQPEVGEIEVCGRCFTLTAILDQLKELNRSISSMEGAFTEGLSPNERRLR